MLSIYNIIGNAKKKVSQLNLRELWEYFDTPATSPDKLKDIGYVYAELQPVDGDMNPLPYMIEGFVFVEGSYWNAYTAKSGQSPLPYHPKMLRPVYIDGFSNSNNDRHMYFIPVGEGHKKYTLSFQKSGDIAIPVLLD